MRRHFPTCLCIPFFILCAGVWYHIPFIIGASFLVWLVGATITLAVRTPLTSLPWRTWFTAIIVLTSFMVLHTAVYLVYASTTASLLATLGVMTIAIMAAQYFLPPPLLIYTPLRAYFSELMGRRRRMTIFDVRDILMALAIIFLQLLLTATVYHHRVYDTLVSPWQVLSSHFLLGYFFATAGLLFFAYMTTRPKLTHVLTATHTLLTFSIVSLLFPLGFGYDPFLHRATELHIFSFGFAEPKNPFYIGQYVLVNLFAHFSFIPLKYIDIWLVPMLTAVFLPAAVYLGLVYGSKLSERMARLGAVMVTLFPLETLAVTTPHNLANLLLFTTIFLLPMARHKRLTFIPLACLSLAALATHPLTGIFACSAVSLFWLAHSYRTFRFWPRTRRILVGVIGAGTTISIASFFALYFALRGTAIPPLSRVMTHAENFLHLLRNPYYYSLRHVPLKFELIYLWKRYLPLLILVSAVAAYIRYRRDRSYTGLLLFIAGACSVNAFLLTTWLEIPALNMYEQLQYGERLLHVAVVVLIPGALVWLLGLIQHQLYRTRSVLWLTVPLVALLATVSLYLTYPQVNPKVRFPGFNVTAADEAAADSFAAVTSTPYIVLSDILTAAASVESYGFRTYYPTPSGPVFYYAIPSGGPLANAFNAMLYEGQHRETMNDIMDYAGVTRGYFVVHSYWDNAGAIIAGATKTADAVSTITTGNTTLTIFTYDRASTSTPSINREAAPVHISPTAVPKS